MKTHKDFISIIIKDAELGARAAPSEVADTTAEHLMKAERAAWKALMNDPKVIADPKASHTPEIKAYWEAAAEAERHFREVMFAA